MASMREIKRHKVSIQSTQQITKAMKLTSTVKLQKAKVKAEQTKPYFEYMYQTVTSMLAKSGEIDHPYMKAGGNGRKAVIVISSNRGLAGGYNSNVVKLVTNGDFKKEETEIYSIGRKGRDTLVRHGYQVQADYSDAMEDPKFQDASHICRDVLEAFAKGEVSEIYLAYTVFRNTVSHDPKLVKLLPVEIDSASLDKTDKLTPMNYEPDEEEALDLIIPKYVTSLIYGALIQSLASENGARMQAMDSATSNADQMIQDLSLLYNRARQGSITQELTEIIAGAEAIS